MSDYPPPRLDHVVEWDTHLQQEADLERRLNARLSAELERLAAPREESAFEQTKRVHKMVAEAKASQASRRQADEAQQRIAELEASSQRMAGYIREFDGPAPPPKPELVVIRKPPPRTTYS